MKIRNDFVTNSSSSSFILEKGWDIDDAFNVLTDWCKDYDKRMDQAIEYIKAQGYEINTDFEPYMHITPFDENYWQVVDEIERKFKVSRVYTELPDSIADAASCKNYAQYIHKNPENKATNRFVIKTMAEICKDHKDDSWDIYSDLISWYVDDEEDPIDIDEFLEKTRDSVVVYAEDPGISYYPEFVLNELRDMSIFSCSHMG